MPVERLVVAGPGEDESRRRLAEAVADLHFVLSIIAEHATEFVPGEVVDDFKAAWNVSRTSMQGLVSELTASAPEPNTPPAKQPPLFQEISKAELQAEVGKIKTSTLSRLRDHFFSFWYSHPMTDEKRRKASEAAQEYLDYGATVISSIPGHETIVEFLSLTKHILRERAKRGR